MPLAITGDPHLADLPCSAVPAQAAKRPAEVDACALCRLPPSQHGVHLIHRFVPPGRPIASR